MKQAFTQFIRKYHINSYKTDFYYKKGFSDDIISKYKLAYSEEGFNSLIKDTGFMQKCQSKKMKCYPYFIPCYDAEGLVEYIIVRRDDDLAKQYVKANNEEITNYKSISKTYTYNNIPVKIFNSRYIKNADIIKNKKVIFITESWTDALSVEDIGYKAISLNSINNIDELIDFIKLNSKSLNNITFICACDRDEYGKLANQKLYEKISDFHRNVIIFENIPEKYKDLNEWLIDDREGMVSQLDFLINELIL